MNLDTIREIVKVAKEEGVDLTVEGKDFKVSVALHGKAPAAVHHVSTAAVHHAPAAPVAHPAAAASKNVSNDAGLHVIKSPFVGTYYAAPSPGKPVYVKVGSKVTKGQALCVLEAMKIMNEIDADIAGEIVEICVENESLVEFGQPLFKIKP